MLTPGLQRDRACRRTPGARPRSARARGLPDFERPPPGHRGAVRRPADPRARRARSSAARAPRFLYSDCHGRADIDRTRPRVHRPAAAVRLRDGVPGEMSADARTASAPRCAVGLVAGSTLALQVLLTRIFSAVLFYHFALPRDLARAARHGRRGDPALRAAGVVVVRAGRPGQHARASRAGRPSTARSCWSCPPCSCGSTTRSTDSSVDCPFVLTLVDRVRAGGAARSWPRAS